jgi:hypothetical protein
MGGLYLSALYQPNAKIRKKYTSHIFTMLRAGDSNYNPALSTHVFADLPEYR